MLPLFLRPSSNFMSNSYASSGVINDPDAVPLQKPLMGSTAEYSNI
jgi:hypothetical protein